MRNGKLLWSRIFENADDALKEAAEERQRTIAHGAVDLSGYV